MALIKNPNRQWPLVARVDFTQGDLATGIDVSAIDIPGGATIIGGALVVTTAGDSVTSDTITVGDGTTTDRYASAVNGKAAARTALSLDGLVNDSSGKGAVTIKNVAVGTEGTAMVGYLEVNYVIDGRGNESQPV
jgi:FtsP/CotA-like multicopper oxidase with cupredoxin domain